MKLKGINVSGALMLDLDVAQDAAQDPILLDTASATAAGPPYSTAEAPVEPSGASEDLFATPQGGNSGVLAEEPNAGLDSDAINTAFEAADAGVLQGPGGTLAHAAQKAQMEHAQQALSDAAATLKRHESTAGHGPFENVSLEPEPGRHSICILV